MALPLYLAMTAAELSGCDALPDRVAWMACHFSPYTTGLSNCPAALPPGSIVILNDRMPVQGHDPQTVAQQLAQTAGATQASAVLLDFQRPDNPEAAAIAQAVLDILDCPVAVTEQYAKPLPCPVLLSPPPMTQPLEAYLAPWAGRELWLEAALGGEIFSITQAGSHYAPCPAPNSPEPNHLDPALHCRYHMQVQEDQAIFTLWRTRQELTSLLAQAQALGVSRAVGLYQELGAVHMPSQ